MRSVLGTFQTVVSPLYPYLKQAIKIISVEFNPLSPQRKRLFISRYLAYTKDALKRSDIFIDKYTYGTPTVMAHPGRTLKIGKFCSIAGGVIIHLGGNHSTEFITTYPFRAFIDDWPEAEYLDPKHVSAISKGDVIIGNDV